MTKQLQLIDAGDLIDRAELARRCTAAPSGSGPAGETCKTCQHYIRYEYHNKHYPKCGLMQANWTHGRGSDIRASWPACREWEARPKAAD